MASLAVCAVIEDKTLLTATFTTTCVGGAAMTDFHYGIRHSIFRTRESWSMFCLYGCVNTFDNLRDSELLIERGFMRIFCRKPWASWPVCGQAHITNKAATNNQTFSSGELEKEESIQDKGKGISRKTVNILQYLVKIVSAKGLNLWICHQDHSCNVSTQIPSTCSLSTEINSNFPRLHWLIFQSDVKQCAWNRDVHNLMDALHSGRRPGVNLDWLNFLQTKSWSSIHTASSFY